MAVLFSVCCIHNLASSCWPGPPRPHWIVVVCWAPKWHAEMLGRGLRGSHMKCGIYRRTGRCPLLGEDKAFSVLTCLKFINWILCFLSRWLFLVFILSHGVNNDWFSNDKPHLHSWNEHSSFVLYFIFLKYRTAFANVSFSLWHARWQQIAYCVFQSLCLGIKVHLTSK